VSKVRQRQCIVLETDRKSVPSRNYPSVTLDPLAAFLSVLTLSCAHVVPFVELQLVPACHAAVERSVLRYQPKTAGR